MAGLGLKPQLIIDVAGNAYGVMRTPPFSRHDQMVNVFGSPGYSASGVRIIRAAGVACLEPQPLLADLALGMFTFPSGTQNWTTTADAGTKKRFLAQPDSTAGVTFEAKTKAVLPASSAFYAVINRGHTSAGVALSPSTYYTVLEVGADAAVPSDPNDLSAGAPYRLICQYNRAPILQRASVSGGAWVYPTVMGLDAVESAQLATERGLPPVHAAAAAQDIFGTSNRTVYVEWWPIPDQNVLIVSVTGVPEPLVFRGDPTAGYPIQVAAGRLRFYGVNGSAALGYFPMRFATSGTFLSSPITLPDVYQGNGLVLPYGASTPSGTGLATNVVTSQQSGTQIQYQVNLSATADGSGLAPTTPFVRDIALHIPPTFAYTSFTGGYADLSDRIAAVQEDQWFDRSTLTARTQVRVTLDNTDGYFSGWTAGIHYAAQYSRNLLIQDAASGGMLDYTAPNLFITGWAGHDVDCRRADPARYFDIIIEDGLWPSGRKQVGYVGFLDGWCFLSAMRFLENLRGRTDDWFDPLFLSCDFGPNPIGCTHFKLPIGTGLSPRMAFQPGTSHLAALQEIASYVHGVLWADEGNILRIMPYYPGIYQQPNLGTFTDSGAGDGDSSSSEFLTQMWRSLDLSIDTKDRRTGVALFGLDTARNEVQGTYLRVEDLPGYAGWTNLVHGFDEPLVVVSKLFVDPVFTAEVAQAALERIILPDLTTVHGAAFLPGMRALYQYNVAELDANVTLGTAGSTLQMSCERITSRWNADQPSVFGSTILGRSIYNV